MNESTRKEIEKLAKSMNVSFSDVLALAQSTANSIEKDGITETFNNASDEDQNKIAIAYGQHAVKKMDSFATTYTTNPAAKSEFQKTVYNGLVNKINK